MTLEYPRKFIIQAAEERLKIFREDREFGDRVRGVLTVVHQGKCTDKELCCLHAALGRYNGKGHWESELEQRLVLLRESTSETIALTETEAVNLGILDKNL